MWEVDGPYGYFQVLHLNGSFNSQLRQSTCADACVLINANY